MGYTGGVKREREEEDGSPIAAASQRRGVPPRPAPPPADEPPVLLPFEDSIRFVLAVKREFDGEPVKNLQFLTVMRGFRLGIFGVDGVVSRLQPLFQGHPDLIRDFNAFLPRGYVLRDNQQGGDADA
ncbi:hypothetical protein C2845_PM14G05920 [Panicum miliaceum]|uniref:Uncharacterized protein n=1 Tax=Panicum miliaceum TaxID=4540 RepID=A0A3L6PMZ9_PANMI|nr:hypothetical protein C2845_PM14G05920 [Panicum miliaceum]